MLFVKHKIPSSIANLTYFSTKNIQFLYVGALKSGNSSTTLQVFAETFFGEYLQEMIKLMNIYFILPR